MSTPHIIARAARRAAFTVLDRPLPSRFGPGRLARIVDGYRVADLVERNGAVPLVWWPKAPNFGDALSPWLIEKMTGRPVERGAPTDVNYVAVGSVLNRVTPGALVWGTGSFGVERDDQIRTDATYFAVRGPLTRARLLGLRVKCPAVYGDPALLTPAYYNPQRRISHEVGVIVRWSEDRWKSAKAGPGVRLIDLGTNDVESTLDAILSCRRIVSSSLHGLVIADAYGIPAAWLSSGTPKGRAFKFHDYALSVNKHREAVRFDPTRAELSVGLLRKTFEFDGRAIEFDYRRLLDACPFLERVPD